MGVGGKRLGSPPAAAGSQPFAALSACACCQWNYTLVCLFPEELCLTRNLWKACNVHITRGKHVTYELFALVDLRQWGLLSCPPLVTEIQWRKYWAASSCHSKPGLARGKLLLPKRPSFPIRAVHSGVQTAMYFYLRMPELMATGILYTEHRDCSL